MISLTLVVLSFVINAFQAVSAQTVQSAPPAQWWSLIVTPIVAGFVGLLAAFIGIKLDWIKAANQELIKKRISVYDNAIPKLNDVLCFFLIIGSWKDLDPTIIVKRKRELDQIMHTYKYLFSPSVFEQYDKFIHLCFKTFNGIGRDACLRADLRKLQRNWGAKWNSQWNSLFVNEKEVIDMKVISNEYNIFVTLMASEIGVNKNSTSVWRRIWNFFIITMKKCLNIYYNFTGRAQ
ncbi:hypothetical protein [Azospirillum doebereinerae]|uniref:DUF4760 domain-containing protein n=1 Tax=Azospirillum doebereinerae TaxID=92933 RepID=A0A3S1CDQ2_9PROT|nr:hypothetical protein [Azospirillum doebereinerae]RUQ64009.1 hypothetical protein EJ913_27185 [Azospirillum doebereinerae]